MFILANYSLLLARIFTISVPSGVSFVIRAKTNGLSYSSSTAAVYEGAPCFGLLAKFLLKAKQVGPLADAWGENALLAKARQSLGDGRRKTDNILDNWPVYYIKTRRDYSVPWTWTGEASLKNRKVIIWDWDGTWIYKS